MGFVVKGKSSVYLVEKSAEGVPTPIITSADAVEVMEDGVGFEYSRDEIERALLSDTIEVEAPRLGIKQVSGSIPVEFKAGKTEGEQPREKVLYKALLGGARQITSASTLLLGSTASILLVTDSSIYKKNDIIIVKEAGRYEARPIKAVEVGSVELAIPLSGDPTAGTEIGKSTIYHHKDGAPVFDVVHYMGGKIKEIVEDCRAISASLDSWEGGSVSSWNFSVEGLDLSQEIEALPLAIKADFSGEALPPVLLGACVWVNGVKAKYNSLSLSLENTKAEILSACSTSGKIGSRFTQFMASGEISPYMDDDNVDRFQSFNLNETVSIFGYASNPAANVGEVEQVVAFYFPQCKITGMPNGDEDGIMTNNISFKAFKGEGEDTAFLAFI